MLDARWMLGDRGEVFLTASLTQTEAEFDSISGRFSDDVPTELFPDGLPVPGPDPNAPISFADYQFGEIHEYSALEYEELRASLGLRVQVHPNVRLFGAVSLYDLTDDAPYLQDATGSVTLVSGGITWSF
jgi:hypothetical protein